jgi:hypothetical protein
MTALLSTGKASALVPFLGTCGANALTLSQRWQPEATPARSLLGAK